MEAGIVSRVGLDVFEKEPLVHPYLMKSERATLLPVRPLTFPPTCHRPLTQLPFSQHWGTSTTRTVVDAEKEGLANITQFLATGTPNTPGKPLALKHKSYNQKLTHPPAPPCLVSQ